VPENDVLVNGMALNDGGLTETNTINGYGLHTFGLLWECGSWWFGPSYSNGTDDAITTTWALFGFSGSTSWTPCGSTITTTWTAYDTTDQECDP